MSSACISFMVDASFDTVDGPGVVFLMVLVVVTVSVVTLFFFLYVCGLLL